ncbi:Patatin-like phospholipase [Seminavis robusta]|uniref:Patatin-like phospholipase n=1 Tax=Seminavis robusta TaxID=568900 RepID=A0A9N8H3Q4_9STRA|nr:Patatin-like phospholipase [Seminavis robusta]|eukprot:Sro43_g026420.1 Patatin-like phospholipase (625) ;mRNA; f:145648-147522
MGIFLSTSSSNAAVPRGCSVKANHGIRNIQCWILALLWGIPALVVAFVPGTTKSIRWPANQPNLFMSVVPHDMPTANGNSSPSTTPRVSRRVRFLNSFGFTSTASAIKKKNEEKQAAVAKVATRTSTEPATSPTQYNISTVQDLNDYFQDKERRFRDDKGDIDYQPLLNSLYVQGDTQHIGSTEDLDYVHPVAQLLHERRRTHSQPNATTRPDNFKIALAIEGGGMRGCVSAGMVSAIHYLNLSDAFDVIYGSSAGSIVGSYLITRQLPWFGPEVYYDALTTAGRQFIDTRRLLRCLGLGLLDPRLVKDVLTRPEEGKPVLNLSYLLKRTLQENKPLDWNKFVEMQKVQPLKVVASGLKSEKAIIMDMANGSFETLDELSSCMHASCLLPGLAGPMMNLNRTAVATNQTGQKVIVGNNLKDDCMEPLADSLLYEPLPFRAAIREGATHVVTIRSRPDGTDVSGKGSFFEKLIFKRFLLRKNWLPKIYKYLRAQMHKKVYSEDVLYLNQHANSTRDYRSTAEPHILTMALPPGSSEVTKLETARLEIFEGLRRGFARAYDALVEDPRERGRGAEVAKEAFPDEILDYDPLEYTSDKRESAFSMYLRENDVVPNIWGSSSSTTIKQ